MNTRTKGQLRSKAVWGAIMTLVGAFGLLPFGATFDPETGNLTVNVYSVIGAIGTAAIPGGAALSWIGRRFARSAVRGLW